MADDFRRLDFGVWMEKMGFHGKQVAEASRKIGLSTTAGRETYQGKRELTTVERLAMSAMRAGLPAWTPENDAEIADIKSMKEIVERAASRQESASAASDASKAA